MFYGAYNVENATQGIIGTANKRDVNTAGGNKRKES
jgi:hypothetical protein